MADTNTDSDTPKLPVTDTGNDTPKLPVTDTGNDTASSSANKRKLEDDGSSTQPAKEGFKQDTTGISGDTDLPSYG